MMIDANPFINDYLVLCGRLTNVSFHRIYNFRTPTLIVADADILKNILVKNFSNFQNRKVSILISFVLVKIEDELFKNKAELQQSISKGTFINTPDSFSSPLGEERVTWGCLNG